MIVPREVIIAIMVRMKLEFQDCKCERCSIDYHEHFNELVQQYYDTEREKMRLHPSGEDLQEEYDRGYDAGLTKEVNTLTDHADRSYQQGQVAMRKKALTILQKYYGPSVYDRIKTLLDEIDLEE